MREYITMDTQVFKRQILKFRPSDIRASYRADGHFFDRKTMRFFGDTMQSFGVFTHEGERYMYRKPSARINIFGTIRLAGSDNAKVWRVVPMENGDVDLVSAGKFGEYA